jgi:hypothetical protein
MKQLTGHPALGATAADSVATAQGLNCGLNLDRKPEPFSVQPEVVETGVQSCLFLPSARADA